MHEDVNIRMRMQFRMIEGVYQDRGYPAKSIDAMTDVEIENTLYSVDMEQTGMEFDADAIFEALGR